MEKINDTMGDSEGARMMNGYDRGACGGGLPFTPKLRAARAGVRFLMKRNTMAAAFTQGHKDILMEHSFLAKASLKSKYKE